MPRIVVDVEIAHLEVELLAPAVSKIIDRIRALTFDPDGVVTFPDLGRREGLQLISGPPGPVTTLVGRRYRMLIAHEVAPETEPETEPETAPVPTPVEIEVITDDDHRLELGWSGLDQHVRLSVVRTTGAESVRLSADIAVPDLPKIIGGHTLHASLAVRLGGFAGSATPQVEMDAELGRVSARAAAHLTPGPSRTDRARLELTIRPHGVLRPLVVAWPFVRSRVVAAIRTELPNALPELAHQVNGLLAQGSDPDVIADLAIAEWVATLVVHVPVGASVTEPDGSSSR